MPANKTVPTGASVDRYLAAIKDPARRADCEALAKLMTKATKHPPKMWGSAIVGFGKYRYKYASGHEGESCLAGFASRAKEITLYLGAEFADRDALLAKLGKHKAKGGCVHIARLADVDHDVLTRVIATAASARVIGPFADPRVWKNSR